MKANGARKAEAASVDCPECGRPAVEAHRPFCSKRCRQIDLGRWLSDSYAIPGEPAHDTDD